MIWINKTTGQLYVGTTPLSTLTPLERTLLIYFINHPHRYLTKSNLIENTWPDVVQFDGVGDRALYQLIYSLRTKISDYDERPYIETWRGNPEGGYRFIPDAGEAEWVEAPYMETSYDPLVRDMLIALMQSYTATFTQLQQQAETLIQELSNHPHER